MRSIMILSSAVLSLFLCGCDKDSPAPAAAQSPGAPSPASQDALVKPPPEINNFVDATKEIQKLRLKVMKLEFAQNAYKTATFDPTGDKSYQRVDSNVGYFLVMVDNVEPYLDGQKISLLIGNPNNMTYSGAVLTVMWSNREPDSSLPAEQYLAAAQAYTASVRETTVNLTDTLRPGNWNKVSFTIAPAKATEFGSLQIGITTNQVSLATARY